jgi:ribosome-binding ATPase
MIRARFVRNALVLFCKFDHETQRSIMALSIGIVGLPNVGKSTLFNALTNNNALAANYPFATIEPNVGVVPVPDSRLKELAKIDNPEQIVPATVEFVDIAGLVAGASKGEGLGNQFLANIRETNAICEVVRYFNDPDVVHVDGRVNPSSDVETIKTELILADMGTIEKALPRLEKEAKRDKAAQAKLDAAKKAYEGLNEGHRVRTLNLSEDELAALYDLHLLTVKPILYVANVDEDQVNADFAEIDGCKPVPISAKVEADLAELDEDEAQMFLEELGLSESGLARLAREAYALLGLQSYFTSGEKETKAWTIPVGAKAPQAAGVIHSDFERGFIKAETASFEDYVSLGGEKGCRDAGKLRQEGKEYVVQDGDVMHFKFNV